VGVPAQASTPGNRAAGPRAARGLPAAGEWRTLGLFAADDADQLQQTLASMPLKMWRNDNVTPLAPHPNDPGPSTRPSQVGAKVGEAARAHGAGWQGHLERLRILPGQGRALGVYRAGDSAEMEAIVKSLPLDPWMTTELAPHPSDPTTTST